MWSWTPVSDIELLRSHSKWIANVCPTGEVGDNSCHRIVGLANPVFEHALIESSKAPARRLGVECVPNPPYPYMCHFGQRPSSNSRDSIQGVQSSWRNNHLGMCQVYGECTSSSPRDFCVVWNHEWMLLVTSGKYHWLGISRVLSKNRSGLPIDLVSHGFLQENRSMLCNDLESRSSRELDTIQEQENLLTAAGGELRDSWP